MKKLFILCCVMMMAVTACKKEDGPSMRTKLITNGKWKMVDSYYLMVSNNQTTEIFALFPACKQDNLYIFNSDMSVTVDEGAMKCDTLQTFPGGSWAFQEADTKLQLTSRVGSKDTSIVSDILMLNDTALLLQNKTGTGNNKVITTTKYRHVY